MKQKIKKTFVSICLAFALLLCGFPAPKVMAAYDTCLDVRDHGDHQYSMRSYVYLMEEKLISKHGWIYFENGHAYAITISEYKQKWKTVEICICGLGREKISYERVVVEKEEMLY